MKEYILLDDDNNVVKHICADGNFESDKYKVVEALDWEEEIVSEPEPFTGTDGIKANGVIEEEQEDAKKLSIDTIVDTSTVTINEVKEQVKVEDIEDEIKTTFTGFTRTDEIMIQLQEIDSASIRSIRAILAGTDTEEDHKTLKALEKQAKLLREELNVCQEK